MVLHHFLNWIQLYWGHFLHFLNRFNKFGLVEFVLNSLWCQINNFDTLFFRLAKICVNCPKQGYWRQSNVPSRAIVRQMLFSCLGQLPQKFLASLKRSGQKMVPKLLIWHQWRFRTKSISPIMLNQVEKVAQVKQYSI